MSHHVEIEHRAQQSLVRLARADRAIVRRIDAALLGLAENPRPSGAIKMTGSDGWRLRVGDYRVIYKVADAVQVVSVERIGHRRDIYER